MRYLLMINDLKFAIQAAIGFGNYTIVAKMVKDIFKLIKYKRVIHE